MVTCRLSTRIREGRIREGAVLAACHLALLFILLTSGCLVPGGGGTPPLEVSSVVFTAGGQIPVASTCDGEDSSPPLSWAPVPMGTKSLALLVTDPDAPGRTFIHWAAYNIPPGTRRLPAGDPGKEVLPEGSLQGTNDMGRAAYNGPCPPKGTPHRYHFTISALDTMLNLTGSQDGRMLEEAMAGHVLARGELVGIYQRA
jgi:Raf kinase inhibitor-like YbhB/YbcL family protein